MSETTVEEILFFQVMTYNDSHVPFSSVSESRDLIVSAFPVQLFNSRLLTLHLAGIYAEYHRQHIFSSDTEKVIMVSSLTVNVTFVESTLHSF